MFIIKYLKSFMYIFISILVLSIIVGTLNYFNIFSTKVSHVFEVISIIISMFIGGIYLGRKSNKRGYLEGIKMGIVMIIFVLLFSYLAFSITPKLSSLIFYAIILISSILGSVIGINKKAS